MTTVLPEHDPLADDDPAPVALLVVRAWWEGPGPRDVRARIWQGRLLPDEAAQVQHVAGLDRIEEAVLAWLRTLRTPDGG